MRRKGRPARPPCGERLPSIGTHVKEEHAWLRPLRPALRHVRCGSLHRVSASHGCGCGCGARPAQSLPCIGVEEPAVRRGIDRLRRPARCAGRSPRRSDRARRRHDDPGPYSRRVCRFTRSRRATGAAAAIGDRSCARTRKHPTEIPHKQPGRPRAATFRQRGFWSYARAELTEDAPGLLPDGADAFKSDRLAAAPEHRAGLIVSRGMRLTEPVWPW